jgi:hypothetical protein
MTETFADPIVLTTDEDFRVYRRHSRQVVPCMTPEWLNSFIWAPSVEERYTD